MLKCKIYVVICVVMQYNQKGAKKRIFFHKNENEENTKIECQVYFWAVLEKENIFFRECFLVFFILLFGHFREHE